MSFASLSGARVPHGPLRLVTIAVFSLPGGDHAASAGIGHSVGWQITAGAAGTLNKWRDPEGTSVQQHAWLTQATMPAFEAPAGYVLYADALARNYVVRATTLSVTPPASGGTDVWRDLAFAWEWWVNTGGGVGEVVTSTILLEIAETINNEPGPVLASGQYTMTATRI